MNTSVAEPLVSLTLEDKPCPLGCAADDRLVVTGRDRISGGPGEFRVVRCNRCGLLRTNPRPTPESMSVYYPDDYGPYVGTRVEVEQEVRRSAARALLRRAFEFNAQRLPPLAPGRALEIGCASGAFLHALARHGWDVEGIEFSPTAAAAARALGYRVHSGSLEGASDVSGGYNLLVGWMVLEHLHDPLAALRKLREWSRPGAYLAVSTPNAGSLERRLFGECWYAWHLPAHLFHYTPRTAAAVLEAGGWRLERVFHQRLLGNLVGSVGYAMQDHGILTSLGRRVSVLPENGKLFNYGLYPLALLLAAGGQTGRMTMWARRIDD